MSWHLCHGIYADEAIEGTWLKQRPPEAATADARHTARRDFRMVVVMITVKEAATQFLANKRVAVTGVSRNTQGHGSNVVYQRLRQRGFEVFAVNPNAETVEGDRAYPDLTSIPGGVEAVVIGTKSETAEATMLECAELGIQHVWMHRSFGAGSVSAAATDYGREQGITVIDGGCPLMFEPTADVGHKCMRFFLGLTGAVPKRVS
jgi:predicted CoA-binding protein